MHELNFTAFIGMSDGKKPYQFDQFSQTDSLNWPAEKTVRALIKVKII